MILEKVTSGNGAGRLLVAHYVEEVSIFSFSDHERWILEKTIRAFRRELAAAGFLPIPEVGDREAG